jgi:hypothetical protein
VQRTRVAVVNLSGLLAEMLEAVLREQLDMEVVDTLGAVGARRLSCASVEADAFVVGTAPAEADKLAHGVLLRQPRSRVLAVVDDGREGRLYRLRMQRVDFDELSVAGLIGALRDESLGSRSHGHRI